MMVEARRICASRLEFVCPTPDLWRANFCRGVTLGASPGPFRQRVEALNKEKAPPPHVQHLKETPPKLLGDPFRRTSPTPVHGSDFQWQPLGLRRFPSGPSPR